MKRVGEMRVRALRVLQYFAIVTFGSSLLTVVKVYDLPVWMSCLLGGGMLVVLAILYYLDPFVARGEAAYFNENNEVTQKIIRDLDAIKRGLGV